MPDTVIHHYSDALDLQTIIDRVHSHYPDGASVYQLAPVDQLHTGGIKASEKLLEHLPRGGLILDIGSGSGGLGRLAMERLDCNIVGIDLTHPFNQLNQQLSRCWNMPARPSAVTGDGQLLPFADNTFDAVIYQHSLVNMPDKAASLQEAVRVLAAGGSLILHEILQGPAYSQLRFPVPWATDPEDSHLMQEADLLQLIENAAGEHYRLSDWSESALQWRQRQGNKESSTQRAVAPLSPALILGPEFKQMGANIMQGLTEQAIQVVEIVARKGSN